MKICRFDDNKVGVVRNEQIYDVTSVVDALPSMRYPLPLGDPFISALPSLRDKLSAAADRAAAVPVSAARLLSPVADPSKIVGAPVNYKKHLDEVNTDPNLHHQNAAHMRPIQQAGLFLKATSSLIGASQGIELRHADRRTDHEVELAVVIGTRANRVGVADALRHVAGYCIGLDITVRGPEDRSMRKSIDTYSVLGPCLVTADEIADPAALNLSLTVNGEPRQDSNTRNLIMGVAELIAWASSFYTLLPGDVIMTGTPDGVGPIASGDLLHARIDQIGEMNVRVR